MNCCTVIVQTRIMGNITDAGLSKYLEKSEHRMSKDKLFSHKNITYKVVEILTHYDVINNVFNINYYLEKLTIPVY